MSNVHPTSNCPVIEILLRNEVRIFVGLSEVFALTEEKSKRKLSKFRELINSCPLLSDYKKSLLFQIDIEEKTVTEVAEKLGKAESTVRSQRSKAFQNFIDWWRAAFYPLSNHLNIIPKDE